LHRNDSQLIFFINPDKESFSIIMEDTSTIWPVSIEATGVKESVTFFEQEMIINQLLLVFFRHSFQRVVFTCKFSSKFR